MEKRIVNNFERFLTTIVNDIEHIESQSLTGIAVVKIFLQPGANVAQAIAQTTAVSQTVGAQMPPGTQPPLIISYSASSVPIMQLALSSDTLSEQQLFDYGVNFIRAELATVPGAQIPYPYGGKQRQIMVDIDPAAAARVGAVAARRPDRARLAERDPAVGHREDGTNEYDVDLNGSPRTIDELNDLPIKTVDGTPIYMRDVANVRDGYTPQTNMVHVDGQRGAADVDPEERQRLDARRHPARVRDVAARSNAAAEGSRSSRSSISRCSCARRSTAWCARR